ncbi:MAG: tRNA (N6-isopentenyl adenosine(37)-C2)-methylthiotransferase MiaB, partial [Candidatus Omnitrophica bacterium]|nr:tRNA (N6-isopentenyl adenosine(37)-C2)-methylthiotransferase MiaB [Candidatus Omnitrophota bacterium]
MKRRYTASFYKKLVNKVASEISDVGIGVDVIVGFPGETEEDFEKTKELCREFRFFNVRIFGYTDRPDTEASKMNGKIPQKIINKRIKRLIEDIEAFAKKPRR